MDNLTAKAYKFLLPVLIIMFYSHQGLEAQSLAELIEKAREINPGIKSINSEYLAAQYWADQTDDYPDPMVSVGVGVLPIETRLGAQRMKLGISQSIPWKGLLKSRAELATAKAATLAHLADNEFIKIEYEIRNAYAQLIMIQEKKSVVNEKLKALDVLEELAKSAVRSGKGKLSNVLFVERSREVLEYNLKILDKEKEKPTIMINRWTGRPLSQMIEIWSNEMAEYSANDDINLSDHPQIKTLEANRVRSMASVRLIENEKKPSIGLGLEYSLISGRPDLELDHNGRDVIMPMGSISIPLNTSRFKAKRQEEMLIQQAIDLKIENLNEQFRAEIASAQSSIELAEIEHEKYIQLKEITSETLQLMRTEYASEGTRFEELIRLELELIDYEEGIIQAEFLKNLALATLEKYK